VVAAALAGVIVGSSPGVADEPTVLISRPGTVFHKTGAIDLRGRGHEKTLSEAIRAGYTPCHACFAAEAKTSRSAAGTPSGATTSSSTTGTGTILVTSATTSSSTTSGSTFGLRHGASDFLGGARGAIRDPYADLMTVLDSGFEQGAYCACLGCSAGK
jgi:hypothetical protein